MFCHKCGHEISENIPYCPFCGKQQSAQSVDSPPNLQPPAPKSGCGRKIGCALVCFFGIGIVGGIISSVTQTVKSVSTQNDTTPAPVPVPESTPFDGDCGIQASAHMESDDFINHPRLKISLKNVSGRNISAIQFYAIPYDVYGKDISSSFLSMERLYTDDLIPTTESKSITFGPFLDQRIKSVKLYVYSVYYEDGTEWGDHEASRSQIIKWESLKTLYFI